MADKIQALLAKEKLGGLLDGFWVNDLVCVWRFWKKAKEKGFGECVSDMLGKLTTTRGEWCVSKIENLRKKKGSLGIKEKYVKLPEL